MPTKTPTRKILAPLHSSPLKTQDGRLLPSNGAKVCRWIEANCLYGEGDWYGQPVRLREWQKRFIWRLYEFWPETELRRYKRALLGMGKGNGKSPLAAWIGAYELLGGTNVSPRVIIGAASLKQANLVFGDLKATITGPTDSPSPLKPYVETFDLEIHIKGQPGVAERIAAEAGTNDGARCTCFIPDELHEWDGRRERVYLIVEGAVAKRQNAFTLAISTAGVKGASLLEDLYEEGKKLSSGELVDDEVLFEWWEAPETLDLDDEKQWLQAVRAANPAAGDFNSIENIRSRFRRIPRHEWVRYHLNRFTQTESAWLPPGWDDLKGSGDGRVCLAFRGAYDNSQAALLSCTRGGHLRVLGSWEGGEDYQVPRSEVQARIDQAMKDLDVARFAYHEIGWVQEGQEWKQIYGDAVAVIYPDVRYAAKWALACSKFYTAVVSGQVSHDGSPVLSRHLQNVQPKETKDGTYITTGRKETAAAIAAVIAYDQGTSMPEVRKRVAGF